MDPNRRDLTPRYQEKRIKLDVGSSAKKESSSGTPGRAKVKTSLNNCEDVRKVTVAVRIRPFNSKESTVENKCPFSITDSDITVNSGYTGDGPPLASLAPTFSYDHIFWSSKDDQNSYCDQKTVFQDTALPLLSAALDGYNVCLFAYGQTGSGKSYSMMGRDNSITGNGAGIIPRFCEHLLNEKNIRNRIALSMTYFEIYNEKIHDLLNDTLVNECKVSLRVREHPVEGPYVEDLSKHEVHSIEDVKKLLVLGNKRRSTSATIQNNYSSRSHAIVEISIWSTASDKTVKSKVSLVDLAGSERVSQHNITGEHFKEGLSINKSLLTLGKVITSLSDRKGSFVPYRESVLTWLLKESLGGNSRTVMLATISPSALALEETLSTLRYACQARHILNKVVVNEDPQLKIIRELKAEVDRLKSLHEHKKNERIKMDSRKSKGAYSATSEYIKYENELLNIEKAQKLVEEQLQAELSRIGLHLQAAERRRDELESQKNVFLEKIKTRDVSQYKSDFYKNLQEILNNSTPGSSAYGEDIARREIKDNLKSLKSCLSNLKRICTSDKENSLTLKRIEPLVEYMNKCYQDVCEILDV